MPVKTSECFLPTMAKRSQQYEDWPYRIPANNCLTCEHIEIIRKSI